MVRTFTNEGGLVLDNTFGSGSFLVAAAMENRDFCGIEQNKDCTLFKKDAVDYISIASERLQNIGCHAKIVRQL